MTTIENISKYKTTSSILFVLEKPIKASDVPYEERFIKTHSSYQKKTFFDLSKHRDAKINDVKQACLNVCIDKFPDYSAFVAMRSACILGEFNEKTRYNKFRISASRNDTKKQIFLTIELAFCKDLQKLQKEEEKERLALEEEKDLPIDPDFDPADFSIPPRRRKRTEAFLEEE